MSVQCPSLCWKTPACLLALTRAVLVKRLKMFVKYGQLLPSISAVLRFADSKRPEANFLVVVFMLSLVKSIVESDMVSFLPGMG